ncbi:leucine-rich repeat-containing protein 15-like isoform X1 [Apteryx rowi]|uniref:leucine-rich repeat-containing protein 15-like isoform X1 n=2 Tax=Apteryx rowi TaxID=308060 RepID=UPI000E1D603D|nr:leucine-rich repeat-containing protein 15-like isoform X1 [Apteryx rowi]
MGRALQRGLTGTRLVIAPIGGHCCPGLPRAGHAAGLWALHLHRAQHRCRYQPGGVSGTASPAEAACCLLPRCSLGFPVQRGSRSPAARRAVLVRRGRKQEGRHAERRRYLRRSAGLGTAPRNRMSEPPVPQPPSASGSAPQPGVPLLLTVSSKQGWRVCKQGHLGSCGERRDLCTPFSWTEARGASVRCCTGSSGRGHDPAPRAAGGDDLLPGLRRAKRAHRGHMEQSGWVLLLVGLHVACVARAQCPEQCQCVRAAQVECSGASITAVPSPIPENTMTLQIINTRITELGAASFGNASMLIGLRIEKNDLSRISPRAFQYLPSLRYLSLASNKLRELPVKVFEPLGQLESLLLSSNQILHIEPSHFAPLSNLKELQLHGNNLHELTEGVFDPLTSLTKLNLARNNIDHLPPQAFERLTRLQVLRLYENRLRQIPAGAFDGLPELEELGLHQNQLETLSPELFVHNERLQKLYLSNNLITALPSGVFLPLHALSKITLHVNQLREIAPGAFGPMPNLKELWLYDNELTGLPEGVFSNLTQLQLLVLSKNQMRSVSAGAFQGLGELLELSLHSNALQRLDAEAFRGLPKLQNISLQNNQLRALPQGLFGATPALRKVQLQVNVLEYLPAGVFAPLTALQEVRLHNNSWHCNEKILALKTWLEANQHKVGEIPPVCALPLLLRGAPIVGLQRDQLLSDGLPVTAEPESFTATSRPGTPLSARPSKPASTATETGHPTVLPAAPGLVEEEEEEEERGQWGLTRVQSGVVVAVIVLVCVALLCALVALVAYSCRKKSHVVLMRMKAPNEA